MWKNVKWLLLCGAFLLQPVYAYYDLFKDKTILILGGTGFIGRALTERLLEYDPKKIIIYSRDEVKHFQLLDYHNHNPKIKSVIGDVRDYDKLLQVMRGVDIVFHAAALKRADMLEHNVIEAVKTNIIASLHVREACIKNNVDKLVFISTDKACSPINAYGACKFVSEKIFTNNDKRSCGTTFVVARYGNVLESTGSIIPIFTEKILNGAEIPLTDERMTRFVISKHEAITLIFDALRYGKGGEIFVKRLASMTVKDLIDILKEKYNASNQIKIVGLRPGEKLHETLINVPEMSRAYCKDDMYVIVPSTGSLPKEELKENLANFLEYSSDRFVLTKDELRSYFKKVGLLS